jgi:hypothetical protein
MLLCRYAPCVRQNPCNVFGAKNMSRWHNDIKKPFHNSLKLDLRNFGSPLLKLPDTRESQSEGGKTCRAKGPFRLVFILCKFGISHCDKNNEMALSIKTYFVLRFVSNGFMQICQRMRFFKGWGSAFTHVNQGWYYGHFSFLRFLPDSQP